MLTLTSEKNKSPLHQMEGNRQFLQHVLFLPATLATHLGIPISPRPKEEGYSSLKIPFPSHRQDISTALRV